MNTVPHDHTPATASYMRSKSLAAAERKAAAEMRKLALRQRRMSSPSQRRPEAAAEADQTEPLDALQAKGSATGDTTSQPGATLAALPAASAASEILPYVTVLIDASDTGPLLEQSAHSGGAFTPHRSTSPRGGDDDAVTTRSAHFHAEPAPPSATPSSSSSPPPPPASPGIGFDGAGGSLYGRLLHRLAPVSPSLAALAPGSWGDVDAVAQALAADLRGGGDRPDRLAPASPAASAAAAGGGASRLHVPGAPTSPPHPAQHELLQQETKPGSPARGPTPAAAAAAAAVPPPPAAELSRQACELQGLAGDLVAVLRQAGDDIRRLRARRRPRRPLPHALTGLMMQGPAGGRAGGDGGGGGDGHAAPGEGRRALSRSCSSRRGAGGRGSASPARAPLRRAVSGRTREWGGAGACAGAGAPALLLRASSRGASVRWAASTMSQPPVALPLSRMNTSAEAAPVARPLESLVERHLDCPPLPVPQRTAPCGAAATAPQPVRAVAAGGSRIPRPQGATASAGGAGGAGKGCGAMSEAAAALAAAAAAAAAVQTHVQSLRDRRRETHGEDPAFVTARLEYERNCRAAQEDAARRRAARLLLGPGTAAAAAAAAATPAGRSGPAAPPRLSPPGVQASATQQPLTSALLATANAAACATDASSAACAMTGREDGAVGEACATGASGAVANSSGSGGGGTASAVAGVAPGPGPRPPRTAVMSRCSSSHSLASVASGMSGVSGVSAAASALSAFSAASSAAARCGYGHAGHGGRVCAACSRRAAAAAAAAAAAEGGGVGGSGCGGGGGCEGGSGSVWSSEGARAQQRQQERAVDAAVERLSGVFEANQVSLGLAKVAAFTYAAAGKRYRLQLLPDGRLAVRRGGGWEELTAALARSPRLAAAGLTGVAAAAAAAARSSSGGTAGAAAHY